MVERKYVLTKVAAGDYLLPSNDGQTIFRLRRYEDGPSHGLEDWPRDREFWGVWKWTGLVTRYGPAPDPDQWDWEFQEGLMDKRGEAIDAAMRLGGGSA